MNIGLMYVLYSLFSVLCLNIHFVYDYKRYFKVNSYLELKIFRSAMWLTIIWCLAILGSLTLYLRKAYSRFSDYDVKHLTVVPFYGNLTRMIFKRENMSKLLQRMYHAFPDDRFIGYYEFMNPLVIIRDLDLIKQITIKDFDSFTDHRSFVTKKNDPLFGGNLFSLHGEEWRDMRSTLSPAFTSSKIKLMVPFMVEVGDQMIVTLKKRIQESGGHIEEEMKNLSTRYANDVIASCAFGLKIDSWTDENNEFYQRGKIVSNFGYLQMLKFFLIMSFPKLASKMKLNIFDQKTKDFFFNLVTGVMRDRDEKHIMRPDMIQLLMEAKKGSLSHDENTPSEHAGFSTVEESDVGLKKHNREWTDFDLVAQAILFFIAGFDTVATSMTFLLMELALNPDVQDKLVKEIRENDRKNNGKFDYKSIQEMTYLDMVVSELLRLWPPGIATDRVCRQTYNLGKANDKSTKDYILRVGEGVWIPIYAIHRNPEYFPDPDKFIPERFSKENVHNIKPFTYMPFGLGPRNCIGSRFALCEVKVMVYQLLRDIEVSPAPRTIIPIQLAPETFNPRVLGGAWLRLAIRK